MALCRTLILSLGFLTVLHAADASAQSNPWYVPPAGGNLGAGAQPQQYGHPFGQPGLPYQPAAPQPYSQQPQTYQQQQPYRYQPQQPYAYQPQQLPSPAYQPSAGAQQPLVAGSGSGAGASAGTDERAYIAPAQRGYGYAYSGGTAINPIPAPPTGSITRRYQAYGSPAYQPQPYGNYPPLGGDPTLAPTPEATTSGAQRDTGARADAPQANARRGVSAHAPTHPGFAGPSVLSTPYATGPYGGYPPYAGYPAAPYGAPFAGTMPFPGLPLW